MMHPVIEVEEGAPSSYSKTETEGLWEARGIGARNGCFGRIDWVKLEGAVMGGVSYQ